MATQVAGLARNGELSLQLPYGQRTRARLGEEVVDAVTNQVVSGAIPPQTPLPSEAEMADGFGVSRTVIREAMKELETMGLVEKHARASELGPLLPPPGTCSTRGSCTLESAMTLTSPSLTTSSTSASCWKLRWRLRRRRVGVGR